MKVFDWLGKNIVSPVANFINSPMSNIQNRVNQQRTQLSNVSPQQRQFVSGLTRNIIQKTQPRVNFGDVYNSPLNSIRSSMERQRSQISSMPAPRRDFIANLQRSAMEKAQPKPFPGIARPGQANPLKDVGLEGAAKEFITRPFMRTATKIALPMVGIKENKEGNIFTPKTPIEKDLYGNEPVGSLNKGIGEGSQFTADILNKGKRNLLTDTAGLGLMGLAVAGDLFPISGGGKKMAQKGVNFIAKSKDLVSIAKTLKQVFKIDDANLAKNLININDSKQVFGIINAYKKIDNQVGKVDVPTNKLYHVSDNPNLKIDPNYKPKQGQMGQAFYATDEPKVWQSGQIGKRPYTYEIDTKNLKIAGETPSRKELTDWGLKNGYFKREVIKKPDGTVVLGTDGKPFVGLNETPKALKLMEKYQDPMTGDKMGVLNNLYLKEKGYDGVRAKYSPDGNQVAIFNFDKIKSKLSQPTKPISLIKETPPISGEIKVTSGAKEARPQISLVKPNRDPVLLALEQVEHMEPAWQVSKGKQTGARINRLQDPMQQAIDANDAEGAIIAFKRGMAGAYDRPPIDIRSKITPEVANDYALKALHSRALNDLQRPVVADAFMEMYKTGKVPQPAVRKQMKLVYGEEFGAVIERLAKNPANIVSSIAGKIAGTFRSIMTSFDLSGGGRQGIAAIGQFPKRWAEAQAKGIKYAFSKKSYVDDMKKMAKTTDGLIFRKYGGSLDAAYDIRPEVYSGADWAEKVPGVMASERAYNGTLTDLRLNMFKDTAKNYGGVKQMEQELGAKGMRGLVEVIDTLTGVGGKQGGWLEKNSKVITSALFSPKLWSSRLQPFNPMFWNRIGPAGRKLAMKSYGKFATLAGITLAAASSAGADIETDPRSADFLKIKVGNTRVSILGGFENQLVFGARQLLGETKSSTTGEITKYGEKFGGPNRLTAATDLLRNKLNPVVSLGADLWEGKDRAGNELNKPARIIESTLPMALQDIYDISKEKGVVGGLPYDIAAIAGFGSQTYGKQFPALEEKDGKQSIKLKNETSIGEDLINLITGKQKSNIPESQWDSLITLKKQEKESENLNAKQKEDILNIYKSGNIDDAYKYGQNNGMKNSEVKTILTNIEKDETRKSLSPLENALFTKSEEDLKQLASEQPELAGAIKNVLDAKYTDTSGISGKKYSTIKKASIKKKGKGKKGKKLKTIKLSFKKPKKPSLSGGTARISLFKGAKGGRYKTPKLRKPTIKRG